jgi:hypothetical protein
VVRYFVAAVAVLSLVACGSSSRATRSFWATRPLTAPLVKEPLATGEGVSGIGDHGVETTVSYHPRAKFAVGFALDNNSRSPIVVTRVRAVEPPRTLVRQVGSVLTLWNPPTCHGLCPFFSFPITPSATATDAQVELAPGERLGVGLDFRLRPCSAIPPTQGSAPSRMEVTFHVPGGRPQRQSIELGGSRPDLQFRSGCGVTE